MAVISGIRDTLDAEVSKFEQVPLRQPVLLNSVPKGGTHLLRNIVRMFVPVEQHYDRDFIQVPNMHLHLAALNPYEPRLAAAHLLFDDQAVANVRTAKHIILVRDPYDWVLARARFMVSDAFHQQDLEHLKSGIFSADVLINMMIFGIHAKSPTLLDTFTHNAVAWMGAGVHLVRYEDILRAIRDIDTPHGETYFRTLLEACGIDTPKDWKARVLVGSDRKLSRTARENLQLPEGIDLPATLSDEQKRLVDFHAPGLRALLGYV